MVIDVAMTETARQADYVLPGASQFEKWECTFFNLEFPDNYFHLRRPVFEPPSGHPARVRDPRPPAAVRSAPTTTTRSPRCAEAARTGRTAYTAALFQLMVDRPELGKLLPVLLYETLGPTLTTPDGVDAAGAAAVWGLAQQAAGFWDASIRRAGIGDPDGGDSLGEALFDQILANPSGIVFSRDDYDETIKRLLTPDGKVNLVIPSLLEEFDAARRRTVTIGRQRRVPVRTRSRRAPLVDRQHDLPRPVVAQAGPAGCPAVVARRRRPARAHRRRPRQDHHQARRRRRGRSR